MFKKIKQRSLEKQIEKLLEKRDNSQLNVPLKTIGFLVHEGHFKQGDLFYEFYKELTIQPKDIKVFSFLESKKKLPSLKQNQVYNKDFTWNGILQNQNAKEFLNTSFDVLVGYYKSSNPYLDYMIASSNAKFKVGLKNCNPELYDLIIDIEINKVTDFKTELIKYLTILKKI
jgi:hypothetical protein